MKESDLGDKDAIQAAVRQVAAQYLKDPNINSVGIGYRVKDGKRTDELALQFTVGQKVAAEALAAEATTPIPPTIVANGITFPTDVVQREFETHPVAVAAAAKSDRKRRLDPIQPGASIANVRETAGTLACLVTDNATGRTHLLSNWHVFHGPHGALGDAIAQPGPADDNAVDDNLCGTLVRSFLGLAGDCALASITNRAVLDDALELGVAVRQLGDPELGDRVVKSGRTTGVTYGVVTRIHTITQMTYGTPEKHEIGSFEIGPDEDHPAANDEISMGGDSGSAWLATDDAGNATDMMLGLHFAGDAVEPAEYAVACYASSVFGKLEIGPLAPAAPGPVVVAPQIAGGYDPGFLQTVVDLPTATPIVAADIAPTKAGAPVRHYTHFSLSMSMSRRFCRWVAWNIDGGAIRKLPRTGISFKLDDAYAPEHQVGEELYAHPRLDRGHIARRADLVWGSPEEADRANVDSFFFPNITPQLDDFNQSGKHGLWGQLENEIFAGVKVDDLRVSVFGGPLFHDSDFPFKGVLVPRSFWKVIAYSEGGTLKSKAFVLTQDDLETKLESLGLEPFNMYQTGVDKLELMSGLRFGPLAAADTMKPMPEALGAEPVRRIETRSQIVDG